jgi:hypothetical protein
MCQIIELEEIEDSDAIGSKKKRLAGIFPSMISRLISSFRSRSQSNASSGRVSQSR